MNGPWLAVASISGFLSVALGAFGAHGLESRLSGVIDHAKRIEWWKTAAHYQLVHALAIGLVAIVMTRAPAARFAGYGFALGSLLFSGSLYAMALGAPRVLGAVTPLGGLCLLAGWATLTWCGFSLDRIS